MQVKYVFHTCGLKPWGFFKDNVYIFSKVNSVEKLSVDKFLIKKNVCVSFSKSEAKSWASRDQDGILFRIDDIELSGKWQPAFRLCLLFRLLARQQDPISLGPCPMAATGYSVRFSFNLS